MERQSYQDLDDVRRGLQYEVEGAAQDLFDAIAAGSRDARFTIEAAPWLVDLVREMTAEGGS